MQTFYGLFFLIVVCYGHFASPYRNKRFRRLKHQVGDWRPHFGYHPSHLASDHEDQSNHHAQYGSNRKQRRGSVSVVPLDHYVVRLMKKEKQFCNGIIVNQQQVLTASMCMFFIPHTEIVIKLNDGARFNVTGQTAGKGFALGAGVEMLTLLNLERPLSHVFKRAPPICSHRLPIGEAVQLWVWNSRKTNLKKKQVTQINDDNCKVAINDPKMLVLNNSTSCVKNTHRSKSCQRSMGLPYIYKQSFCGLNLLGHNCPKASNADVYVRLFDEKRYISEKLNQFRKFRLDDEIF